MSRPAVVLIQKPHSPYRQMLEDTLDQEYGAGGWHSFASVQGSLAPGTPLVALWDLHGFPSGEVRALAEVLAPQEVGVVLVCGRVDRMVRQALRGTRALALVAEPQEPQEVAAALEVAAAIHQRLGELAVQRQELQQELADRQEIDNAKRVLMQTRGFSEAEAMRSLQRHSRNTNRKLAEVARQVLKAHQVFNGNGEDR